MDGVVIYIYIYRYFGSMELNQFMIIEGIMKMNGNDETSESGSKENGINVGVLYNYVHYITIQFLWIYQRGKREWNDRDVKAFAKILIN